MQASNIPSPPALQVPIGATKRRYTVLTDAFVRKAKPGKWSDYTGERGAGRLVLYVSNAGKKTWHYRRQTSTKDEVAFVGSYPEMPLGEARAAARTLGSRPIVSGDVGNFDDLLTSYVQHLRDRGAASADSVESELKLSIPLDAPFRKKQARDVTSSDIGAILQAKRAKKIKRNGEEVQIGTRVNRLRSILSAAINFAMKYDNHPDNKKGARFHIPTNPVMSTPHVKEYEKTRDRVLTREEMRAFFDVMLREQERLATEHARMQAKLEGEHSGYLARVEMAIAMRAIWCCVALTGQRLVQLMAAKQEGDAVLVLTDSKGRGGIGARRHAIPMTERLKLLWPLAKRVATADLSAVRAVGNRELRRVAPGAIPLDLRRTVESRLMALGVSRDDRAELLSHGKSGVQQKHYERDDMLPTKLKTLMVLDDWMFKDPEPDQPSEPEAERSNVHPIRPAKTARG